jgi:hypothetical protein
VVEVIADELVDEASLEVVEFMEGELSYTRPPSGVAAGAGVSETAVGPANAT